MLQAITDMRHALFLQVPHREHTALAIYTFASNQHELMVEGEVDYEHHHGHKMSTKSVACLKIEVQGVTSQIPAAANHCCRSSWMCYLYNKAPSFTQDTPEQNDEAEQGHYYTDVYKREYVA